VFSDAQGTSHLRDQGLKWQGRTGTSNLPTLTTAATPTTKISFVRLPKGQQQDWHPAPAKQFVIVLSGIAEVETEDGQRRMAGPGSVALVSDTMGRGHRTNVVGDQDVVLAFIPVP
jgi:quercetin dioxygenase-like cupin family protein